MAHTIADLMHRMGLHFGSGGLRAPVETLSDAVAYAFTRAFLDHLRHAGHLTHVRDIAVGGDLRQSSTPLMRAVAAAIADFGAFPINAGRLPAPALAHHALEQRSPAILVTGGHLDGHYNGLKFFRADGEAGRSDESGIRQQSVVLPSSRFDDQAQMYGGVPLGKVTHEMVQAYEQRLKDFFPRGCLAGWKIGVLEQSTTARKPLPHLLEHMGAKVVLLGRTEKFLALDTESMPAALDGAAAKWVQKNHLDALVSADADADRPLLADDNGRWLRGDHIGMLAARYLEADTVYTPYTSTTGVEASGWFRLVNRTRVASIDLTHDAVRAAADAPGRRIIGFAAHGGIVHGQALERDGRALGPLPSRDGILPTLAILHHAAERHDSIANLAAELPPRHTDSIRLDGFEEALIANLISDYKNQGDAARQQLSAALNLESTIRRITTKDGIRGALENGDIIHLRPSLNSRSLRIYTEAESPEAARALRDHVATAIREGWAD